MLSSINPKVLGATIIGIGLVAGAYTINNLNNPKSYNANQQANLLKTTPPQRVAIAVTDSDNDGIEDWQDSLIDSKAIINIEKEVLDYNPTDSLTRQTGIKLIEETIRARGYAPFGATDNEVVADVVDFLVEETEDTFYETSDIIIDTNWNNEDIVNYANALADIMMLYKTESDDGELAILTDIIMNEKEDRVDDLRARAEVYKNYRDDTLKLHAPDFLAKEHLDLINIYEAMRADIEGMAMVTSDPAVSLLRLRRHEGNLDALAYTLQNMFTVLEPYSDLFDDDDSAILLVIFSSNFQY